MLSLIVDETVSLDRSQELKAQIITSQDLTGLLDSVGMAIKTESEEVERQHLADLLYKLDEHPLYHERYFELSSDPADLGWFLAQFGDTDQNDAYNRLLFTWVAAILVRYDKSEEYGNMCSQIVILGEYAVPPLQDIVGSETYYASQGRGRILNAAKVLLPRLPPCPQALRSEWDVELARRRGLEQEPA
jgi:hypothetical protein